MRKNSISECEGKDDETRSLTRSNKEGINVFYSDEIHIAMGDTNKNNVVIEDMRTGNGSAKDVHIMRLTWTPIRRLHEWYISGSEKRNSQEDEKSYILLMRIILAEMGRYTQVQ